MARYKGFQGEVTAAGEIVGEVESFDLTMSVAELDANVMGSDWTDVEGGQMSGTGSLSVLRDPADVGQAELVVGSKIAIVLYPESNTTGMTTITGSMLVTERATSVAVGDLVKDVYSVRNSGALTVAAVV